jgi:hypothetical protein
MNFEICETGIAAIASTISAQKPLDALCGRRVCAEKIHQKSSATNKKYIPVSKPNNNTVLKLLAIGVLNKLG